MIYKIQNSLNIRKLLLFIFLCLNLFSVQSQDTGYSKPVLTDKTGDFREQCRLDSNKKMLELKKALPEIVYDLRYASTNNFMHRLMYPAGTGYTFMRLAAVKALQKVQAELSARGLALKIFDAYRPWSVTARFWELVKDERYVANPSRGSGHNRGIAVDLTIIRQKNGAELDMGTGFDNFTDSAHHGFTKLPEQVLQNRIYLRSLMEKYGFKALETEWWHYSLPDGSRYEILDIDFKKLRKNL